MPTRAAQLYRPTMNSGESVVVRPWDGTSASIAGPGGNTVWVSDITSRPIGKYVKLNGNKRRPFAGYLCVAALAHTGRHMSVRELPTQEQGGFLYPSPSRKEKQSGNPGLIRGIFLIHG